MNSQYSELTETIIGTSTAFNIDILIQPPNYVKIGEIFIVVLKVTHIDGSAASNLDVNANILLSIDANNLSSF